MDSLTTWAAIATIIATLITIYSRFRPSKKNKIHAHTSVASAPGATLVENSPKTTFVTNSPGTVIIGGDLSTSAVAGQSRDGHQRIFEERNAQILANLENDAYPAAKLRQLKQNHESKLLKRASDDLGRVQLDVFSHSHFPTALVDQQIDTQVTLLRKSRWFTEFDSIRASLSLGRRLVAGDLSGGTDEVRSKALSWCARILSITDNLNTSEEYLKLAKRLGSTCEADIADAFIISTKGDKSAALTILAGIDSPSSRSAALMIVALRESAAGALDWLEKGGISVASLDPDGKHSLLTQQLLLGRWEAAQETVDGLRAQDFSTTPVLHHMVAVTRLLGTVPIEIRSSALKHVPFEAAGFPLASDEAAMDARRAAQRHFADASQVARELNCPDAATLEDEYALWLELKDSETSDNGRRKLEKTLRDTKSALRLVPLGLSFGIKLDRVAVEQEIERQIVLHDGITQDAAYARLALAVTQETPEAAANYVATHYDALSTHLDQKSIHFLQIELLCRAGLLERANDCLKLRLEEGLSDAEKGRVQRLISEAEGTDPVEARKAQFKQSDSLSDLAALVDALEQKHDWDDLCKYGELLFTRTRTVRDAERFTNALSNAHRSEHLVGFLRARPDLLSQSNTLQMSYSWALYQEGALVEARTQLAKLSDGPEHQNYRALKVNLGIALGDWDALSGFVATEYSERDKRSAQDLIVAAQLALHLKSPHARDLISAAAVKGCDDANVLAGAYFLASRAGWEDEPDVGQWLHKAAELSGNDGPLQTVTLRDVLNSRPDWERRESEMWRLLSRGEIPICLAAQFLNKSLTELTLFPALANSSQRDPRRRSAVPAYSGARLPASLDIAQTTVGVDATALLTLGYLNVLDKALDAFLAVYVPHSTLAWLFEEQHKATFHQPSRIRDAHQLRDLLAGDYLEKFVPSTVADGELAFQIGDELAGLIAEAEMVREDDYPQRIVVRSSPVHRLSSLMEQEADLTEQASVMSSCLSVVKKLREKGQMTADEEQKARDYLQLHEKPWPKQPDIADGAVLYLDDLAITYFLHVGILGRLRPAGLKPVASPRAVSEANSLIAYERIADSVTKAIERIRSAVGSRIDSGDVHVGARRDTLGPGDHSLLQQSAVDAIGLARNCDAIISDDRFLNQHSNIDDGRLQGAIFSTLDLLDALAVAGIISSGDRLEHRSLLRRTGYFFVPVDDDELLRHLNASSVKDGRVIETAELKAIRENTLQVRMGDWLQLPKEASWLDATLGAFTRALKDSWKEGADLSIVRSRSDWLVEQIDPRGWAHSFGPENGDAIVSTGRGMQVSSLFMLPRGAPEEVKDAYWSWLEERILTPIREECPDLYAVIVEAKRREVAELSEIDLSKRQAT